MQHASISIARDTFPTYTDFYTRTSVEEAAEVSQEAVSRFFLFQEQGLFNWEFFCNELEYE